MIVKSTAWFNLCRNQNLFNFTLPIRKTIVWRMGKNMAFVISVFAHCVSNAVKFDDADKTFTERQTVTLNPTPPTATESYAHRRL